MELQSVITLTLYEQLVEEAMTYGVLIFENGVVGSPYINTARGKRYVYWQIKLPDPARFALHKLVVAQERTASFHTKVEKDIAQASEVVEALAVTGRRDDLDLALAALLALPYGSPQASLQKSAERMRGVAKQTVLAMLAG